MSVPLYSNFGKAPKDLLSKGFPLTSKVEVTTRADNGVNFVTSAERKVKGTTPAIVGTFQPKYVLPKYGLEFTGTIDTDNLLKAELSAAGLLTPGLKATLRDTLSPAADIEAALEYKHELGTFTSSVLRRDGRTFLSATATAGKNGVAAGLETRYRIDAQGTGLLEAVTGAVNYKVGAHDITGFVKSSSVEAKETAAGDVAVTARAVSVGAAVHYTPSRDLSIASTLDYDLAKPNGIRLTVGGAYNLDADTQAKAKLSNDGKLGLAVSQQLRPSLKATVGSEINTFDLQGTNHKFGINFELRA